MENTPVRLKHLQNTHSCNSNLAAFSLKKRVETAGKVNRNSVLTGCWDVIVTLFLTYLINWSEIYPPYSTLIFLMRYA